jgi:diguanylate cyclase (GGDEF)-like protein
VEVRAATSRVFEWRRPSLLTSFGLLGAIPLALLAVALGVSLHRIIQRRALDSTRSQAVFTATVGVGAYFDGGANGVSATQLAALHTQLVQLRKAGQLTGLTFWTPSGSFSFGSIPGLAGTDQLRRARAGETVSWLQADKLLVDVPVNFGGGPKPTGVLGIALPYRLVGEQVAHDTRTLYLIVLGGFALLYAVLFPIVARASRELRRQSEENERLARHDALTGLPNRMYFQELLAESDRDRTGAIVVDLDAFKAINDRHGHHAGDELLMRVGERLRRTVRDGDVVARMGGDEFAIIVADGGDERTLEALSRRIVEAIGEPLTLDGIEVSVRASVGASPPDAAVEGDDLVKRADRAMYSAKNAGGGIYRLQSAT